jgi:DNA-binding transcriptional regulator YdaS (Cro superfamily)
MSNEIKALQRAVAALGSAAALSKALGVSSSMPHMWKLRGRIPAEHCPGIERATRGLVKCEELRPDIDWAVLREVA